MSFIQIVDLHTSKFDEIESAMENSRLPETESFGPRQGALLDAPMAFTDLDVVEDVD